MTRIAATLRDRFAEVGSDLRASSRAVGAYLLFAIWFQALNWADVFAPLEGRWGWNAGVGWHVSLATTVVALAAICAREWRRGGQAPKAQATPGASVRSAQPGRGSVALPAVVLPIGIACAIVAGAVPATYAVGRVLYVAGFALVGAGVATLIPPVGRALGQLPSLRALVCALALCSVAASLACALLCTVPRAVAAGFVLVAPPAFAGLLDAALRAPASGPVGAPGDGAASRPRARLLAFALVVLTIGITFGFSDGVTFDAALPLANTETNLAKAAAATLLLLVAALSRGGMTALMGYCVALFSSLSLLLALRLGSWAPQVVETVSVNTANALIWAFAAWFGRGSRSTASFSSVILLFYAGQLAGVGLRGIAAAPSTSQVLYSAIVASYLLVISAAVTLASIAGRRRAPDPASTAGGLDQACALLAARRQLTEREAEVLRLLAGRESNKGIAARLGISEDTAKTHRKHLYEKLGVHSRDELERLLAAALREVEG